MTVITQAELSIFKEIEQLIKTAKDSLLTEIVPSNCNCSNRKHQTSF